MSLKEEDIVRIRPLFGTLVLGGSVRERNDTGLESMGDMNFILASCSWLSRDRNIAVGDRVVGGMGMGGDADIEGFSMGHTPGSLIFGSGAGPKAAANFTSGIR